MKISMTSELRLLFATPLVLRQGGKPVAETCIFLLTLIYHQEITINNSLKRRLLLRSKLMQIQLGHASTNVPKLSAQSIQISHNLGPRSI